MDKHIHQRDVYPLKREMNVMVVWLKCDGGSKAQKFKKKGLCLLATWCDISRIVGVLAQQNIVHFYSASVNQDYILVMGKISQYHIQYT